MSSVVQRLQATHIHPKSVELNCAKFIVPSSSKFKYHSIAPINTLTWTTFYARHRDDEGAIQSLFDREIGEFVEQTTNHFEEPKKLAQTIGGRAYANVVLDPENLEGDTSSTMDSPATRTRGLL